MVKITKQAAITVKSALRYLMLFIKQVLNELNSNKSKITKILSI